MITLLTLAFALLLVLHDLQHLQPEDHRQGAAGHLLRVPRLAAAAGDVPPRQGAAQDRDPLLPRLGGSEAWVLIW